VGRQGDDSVLLKRRGGLWRAPPPQHAERECGCTQEPYDASGGFGSSHFASGRELITAIEHRCLRRLVVDDRRFVEQRSKGACCVARAGETLVGLPRAGSSEPGIKAIGHGAAGGGDGKWARADGQYQSAETVLEKWKPTEQAL